MVWTKIGYNYSGGKSRFDLPYLVLLFEKYRMMKQFLQGKAPIFLLNLFAKFTAIFLLKIQT